MNKHPEKPLDVALFISQRIHALGWTIAQTGERAGVRPQELSAFLNGHTNPLMETVLRIMLTLGLSPLKWQPPANQSTWPTFTRPPTKAHMARMKMVDGVATEIERAMDWAGMNQVQLSATSGVHISTISRLLTRRAMPSDESIKAIRATLNQST